MSVGSRAAECRAVAMAANALSDAGVLVVAAAGNSATDACAFHPASAKAVLTVSAMRLASGIDNVWNRSNFGSCVDIFAPGKFFFFYSTANTRIVTC